VHIVATGKTIPLGHPLDAYDCPVCDGPLVGTSVSLVYVGTAPEDRRAGWHTGAAVAVHDICVGGSK
jgi:hypothetical protein